MAGITRKAEDGDYEKIRDLINPKADELSMIPVTKEYFNETQFLVYEENDEIKGCVGLAEYKMGTKNGSVIGYEIRSHKSIVKGCGKKLLQAAAEKSRSENKEFLYLMTAIPPYYKKLGFKPSDVMPERFQKKCWDCSRYILGDCSEEPMIMLFDNSIELTDQFRLNRFKDVINTMKKIREDGGPKKRYKIFRGAFSDRVIEIADKSVNGGAQQKQL